MSLDTNQGPQTYRQGPIGSAGRAGYGQISAFNVEQTGMDWKTVKLRAGLWVLKVIATKVVALPYALFRVTGDENAIEDGHSSQFDVPAEPVTAYVPRELWLSKNAEIKVYVNANTMLYFALLALPESEQ